jgi:hypothetical protein
MFEEQEGCYLWFKINCSKYILKRVTKKCTSIQDCAILYNLKCEVQSISEIYLS